MRANAGSVLDRHGGTQYVLFRKDRVRYLKGSELVKGLKVDEDSPSRAFASCCNSFMLLDLPSPMHWIPVSRGRFQGDVPPLTMRINAQFERGAAVAPSDVPADSSFPPKFVMKLVAAKFAMMFGS
jgi:hypothetical protein